MHLPNTPFIVANKNYVAGCMCELPSTGMIYFCTSPIDGSVCNVSERNNWSTNLAMKEPSLTYRELVNPIGTAELESRRRLWSEMAEREVERYTYIEEFGKISIAF